MQKERIITVLSIVINSLFTFIKIYAGMIFCSYTLMVSGYNTLCDIAKDFMAFLGSIFRGRRASLRDPFGYGKKENLFLIAFNLLLVFLGIFIIVKALFLEYTQTNIKILFVLLILILFKFMYSKFLFKNAKSIQSELLMDMAHVSYYDALLVVLLVFFAFLANIMPVFDLISTLFMGAILVYKANNCVKEKIISMKGQNIQRKNIIKRIENIVKDGEGMGLFYSNCTLLKYKKYYKVMIEVTIDDEVSLRDLILLEESLKDKVISSQKDIKYVGFLIYEK